MIIIIIIIQTDLVVSDMKGFISFSLQSLTTQGETQFIKAYTNHTMLTHPFMAHLVVSKISTYLSWSRSKLI